mmetsp:Transcript_133/g.259  ORF Transcript_133/g.259 Transcript_133/m.259 type:complete len:411 (+) Transcript_133:23-1255(+)
MENQKKRKHAECDSAAECTAVGPAPSSGAEQAPAILDDALAYDRSATRISSTSNGPSGDTLVTLPDSEPTKADLEGMKLKEQEERHKRYALKIERQKMHALKQAENQSRKEQRKLAKKAQHEKHLEEARQRSEQKRQEKEMKKQALEMEQKIKQQAKAEKARISAASHEALQRQQRANRTAREKRQVEVLLPIHEMSAALKQHFGEATVESIVFEPTYSRGQYSQGKWVVRFTSAEAADSASSLSSIPISSVVCALQVRPVLVSQNCVSFQLPVACQNEKNPELDLVAKVEEMLQKGGIEPSAVQQIRVKGNHTTVCFSDVDGAQRCLENDRPFELAGERVTMFAGVPKFAKNTRQKSRSQKSKSPRAECGGVANVIPADGTSNKKRKRDDSEPPHLAVDGHESANHACD